MAPRPSSSGNKDYLIVYILHSMYVMTEQALRIRKVQNQRASIILPILSYLANHMGIKTEKNAKIIKILYTLYENPNIGSQKFERSDNPTTKRNTRLESDIFLSSDQRNSAVS